ISAAARQPAAAEAATMSGRPIFKKSSPNSRLTCYLGKRDYFDDLATMDLIDGAVLVDPGIGPDKKVFAHIKCEYRYGRGDMDNVMNGVSFKKDFFFAATQVYPSETPAKKLTPLQSSLLSKFSNAHPFSFQLPHDIPPSLMIQSTAVSDGSQEEEPCGVEYYVQVFVARRKDDQPQGHSSVKMAIRRLTCVSPKPGEVGRPSAEINKAFHLHSGSVRLEVSLAKELYHHGEPVLVSVVIDNYSSNVVKGLSLKLLQLIEITLFKEKAIKNVICSESVEKGFPLAPGQAGWCETFKLRPNLADNRNKAGVALDGKMKYQDTNLASSTLIRDFRNKENIGIIVQYVVKARVFTGFGGRDAVLEVPLILSHPKPVDGSSEAKKSDDVVFEHFARLKVAKQDTIAEALD
ncbi:hypothetical protein BOX15_Mlig008725g3, partial [Macrostomum lignano]